MASKTAMMFLRWCSCLLSLLVSTKAFHVTTFTPTGLQIRRASFAPPVRRTCAVDVGLHAKKKRKRSKGFAEQKNAEQKNAPATAELPESEIASETPISADTNIGLNAGQKSLARMRQQRADQKDEEMRKVKELRSIDEFVRDDPNAAVIPEKVAMRMGGRMLPFVGIPLFGGMGAFVGFWYLSTYKNYEFQPALVAFTTIALLAVGLVGITYSIMSSSWDPDEDGSALGAEEFGKNLGNLRDGLKRSRENALIRERMAGLPEEDIQRAIRDLDKRDEKARRKEMSLKDKIEG